MFYVLPLLEALSRKKKKREKDKWKLSNVENDRNPSDKLKEQRAVMLKNVIHYTYMMESLTALRKLKEIAG